MEKTPIRKNPSLAPDRGSCDGLHASASVIGPGGIRGCQGRSSQDFLREGGQFDFHHLKLVVCKEREKIRGLSGQK